MAEQTLRYPTDYYLEELNLITSLTNGKINLTTFMVELNLFEDIFSSTISGEVLVSDALGLISNFYLSGTEFLEVKLKKSKEDPHSISRNYRVYKISKRVTGESNAYEVYAINFCSEEFVIAEQYRISKAFKGTEISKIIKTILNKYIKVGIGNKTKEIYIEDTMGPYDFILPNKKLFETINWLSTYARPKSGAPGADMLFYENGAGYNLKSLQTLYKQASYQVYKYDPKNISTDLNQQVTNVLHFEPLDFFDTLGAIANGTFGNRLITIDPLTRTFKVDNDFSYKTYYGKAKKLNNNAPINNYQNRHKKTMYDTPPGELEVGTLRLATENTNQKKQKYIAQNPDLVANDINIRTYMPNRVAQLALSNYSRIKITIPGDTKLFAGRVVEFNIYGINGTNDRQVDLFYSGKYLVTAIRHIVRNNSYITVMELAKDSVQTAYADFKGGNLQNYINGVQS